ncbi:MAG: hypothetical protein HY691_00975 [Chloroflexi bacterium]|nr:hypothetical protein [Chloroflexota bacterium]
MVLVDLAVQAVDGTKIAGTVARYALADPASGLVVRRREGARPSLP